MRALPKVSKDDIVQRKKRGLQPRAAGALKAKRSSKEGYAGDVPADDAKSNLSRRKILDDLARAEYAEGVYDQVPDDFTSGQ
jgi:hypothetical protein